MDQKDGQSGTLLPDDWTLLTHDQSIKSSRYHTTDM